MASAAQKGTPAKPKEASRLGFGMTAVPLWPHQEAVLKACEEAHRQPRSRVLVQCPASSGKSEIAARAALAWLKARHFGQVLVAVSTTHMLQRFFRRVTFASQTPIEIEETKRRVRTNARFILTTQSLLWDRLDRFPRSMLCIYDGVNHPNFDAERNQSIAESFDHLLGLEASPWSRGCVRLFGERPRISLSLADAIAQQIIAPYELCSWIPPRGPHGVVFCGSDARCAILSAYHRGSTWIGTNSQHVSRNIAAWRRGRYPVIYVNPKLVDEVCNSECTEAWVITETENDILNLQMAGLAFRFCPGKVAKIYCATAKVRTGLEQALRRSGAPVPVRVQRRIQRRLRVA